MLWAGFPLASFFVSCNTPFDMVASPVKASASLANSGLKVGKRRENSDLALLISKKKERKIIIGKRGNVL